MYLQQSGYLHGKWEENYNFILTRELLHPMYCTMFYKHTLLLSRTYSLMRHGLLRFLHKYATNYGRRRLNYRCTVYLMLHLDTTPVNKICCEYCICYVHTTSIVHYLIADKDVTLVIIVWLTMHESQSALHEWTHALFISCLLDWYIICRLAWYHIGKYIMKLPTSRWIYVQSNVADIKYICK